MDNNQYHHFQQQQQPQRSPGNLDIQGLWTMLNNSPPNLNSPASCPQPPAANATPIPSPQSAFAAVRQPELGGPNVFQTVVPSPVVSSTNCLLSAYSQQQAQIGGLPLPNFSGAALGMTSSQHVQMVNNPQINFPQMPSSQGLSLAGGQYAPHMAPYSTSTAIPGSLGLIGGMSAAGLGSVLAECLNKLKNSDKDVSQIFSLLQQMSGTAIPTAEALAAFNAGAPSLGSSGINFASLQMAQAQQAAMRHSSFDIASTTKQQQQQQQQQEVEYKPGACKVEYKPQKMEALSPPEHPPRKIRRRRPKSPGGTTKKEVVTYAPNSASVGTSTAKSEIEEPAEEVQEVFSEEVKHLVEQQMTTPDDPTDPTIHSAQGLSSTILENGVVPQSGQRQMCSSQQNAKQNELAQSPRQSCANNNLNEGDPKKCLVCGDRATGYNFNVITCESCKAFFRRNALRPKGAKDFKCPYNNACDVTAVSRRFCQKCRLRKCFDVGMRKDWILNDDQLKRRKNSRLNSLQKNGQRQGGLGSPPDNSFSTQQSPTDTIMGSPVTSPCSTISNHSNLSRSVPGMDALHDGGRQIKAPYRRHRQSVDTVCGMSKGSPGELKRVGVQLNQQMFASPLNMTSQSFEVMNPSNVESAQSSIQSTTNPQQMLFARQQIHMGMPVINGVPQLENQQANMALLQHQLREIEAQATMNPALINSNNTLTDQALIADALNQYRQQQTQQQMPAVSRFEPQTSCASQMAPLPEASAMPQYNNFAPPGEGVPVMSDSGMVSPPPMIGSHHFSQIDFSNLNRAQMQEVQKQMIEKVVDELLTQSEDKTQHNGEEEGCELLPDCNNLIFNKPVQVVEPMEHLDLSTYEIRQLDFLKDLFTSCMEEKVDMKKIADELSKKSGRELPNDDPVVIFYVMDILMRRIVKMVKKLPSFNELSQEGKLIMLKAAMISLMCVRGVTKMVDQRLQLCFKSSALSASINIDSMFDKLNDPDQKKRYKEFYYALDKSIRDDVTCLHLFFLMVLFDHGQLLKDESDRMRAKRYYEANIYLLKRQLQSTVGREQADEALKSVTPAMESLHIVSEKAPNLFVGKVKEGGELPREFFKTETEKEDGNEGHSTGKDGDKSQSDVPAQV